MGALCLWSRRGERAVVVVGWSLVPFLVSIAACAACVAAGVLLPSRTSLARAQLWVQFSMVACCGIAAAVTTALVRAKSVGGVPEYFAQLSLTHGLIPMSAELIAAVALACAAGWRTRRWRRWRLPVAIAFGVVVAVGAQGYVVSAGWSGEPAPWALWGWVGLTGMAMAVVVLGWREARWWRRATSMAAVPLTLLSCVVVLNGWVGYLPTVSSVWGRLTSGAVADQTDRATVVALRERGVMPPKGVVLSVTIDARASGFHHRDELVYLPPAWFVSNPPPPLPVVLMIGAEFNTPTDWLRAGGAATSADDYFRALQLLAPSRLTLFWRLLKAVCVLVVAVEAC